MIGASASEAQRTFRATAVNPNDRTGYRTGGAAPCLKMQAKSSLAERPREAHNPLMDRTATAATDLPLHPQDEVECRRCDVHCDKVVYPAACVGRACPFLYAYEAHGHTWIGCMQKVYAVEIDLDLLRAAEGGEDGFGAVKAKRKPLPMCRVEVEACYENRTDELGCHNPEFFELPQASASFRIFAQVRPNA